MFWNFSLSVFETVTKPSVLYMVFKKGIGRNTVLGIQVSMENAKKPMEVF